MEVETLVRVTDPSRTMSKSVLYLLLNPPTREAGIKPCGSDQGLYGRGGGT